MMSYRRTRILGLSLIVILLISIGLIPTMVTYKIRGQNADFIAEMEKLRLSTELQELLLKASTDFHDLVESSTDNFSSVIHMIDNAVMISDILEKEIQETDGDEDEVVQVIKQLSRNTRLFRMAVTNYANEFSVDPTADNTVQMEMLAFEAQRLTIGAFHRFIEDVSSDIEKGQEKIQSTMKSSQIVSLIGLSIGVIAGIAVALFIGRSLNKPIQKLVEGTERVSRGDMGYRIDIADSDEIGRLAVAFNRMSENILTHIDEQKRLTYIAEQAAESEKNKSEELVYANQELEKEISNRKRVEEDLLTAKEKAEHSNRVKSDFLANMSHELRTPLNHIIGFTELVLDKCFGELNETQQEYLTDVHTSSIHLLDLINDILDLSKVEADKLDFEPSRIQIRNILKNSLIMVKEKALKHSIAIATSFDDIPESITADERKVKQILYNLLSNAVKFTPNGGSIRVKASCSSKTREQVQGVSHSAEDCIHISVKDSGIGIEKKDLARIFQPFEQVESSANRRFQGTGLGLSLTSKFIEMHGGKIWAESKGEGQGSIFRFTLPIAPKTIDPRL
jgi:signal transduction histidine kinase